jgi:hypothetical protein
MSSHFDRARAGLRKLLGTEPSAQSGDTAQPSIPELPAAAWNAEYLRLMLCPAPGLADRTRALMDKGVLALLLPEAPAGRESDDRVHRALRALEQLLDETTLAGKRFGSLLR